MSPEFWSGLLTLGTTRVLPAFLATAVLGLAALARGSVSPSGATGGLVVGLVFWVAGDWPLWTLLAVFFVSSSVLGIPAKRLRPRVEAKHQRGSRRTWQQVAANTAPMLLAALALLVAQAAGDARWTSVLTLAVVTGFAAAASDTWAGELGVLSAQAPRLLRNGQVVEAGQSGGVTALGTLGALAGALVLSLVGLLAGIGWTGVVLATAIAFASSLVDSLLGGTVQALYQGSDGQWTERPVAADGTSHTLVRGVRWLNNDAVNLVSVAFAVAAALGLGLMLT